MKIAIVTCYGQNDYVRARSLRTAFAAVPGVETIVVRNDYKGMRRYPEVMWRLLKLRFTKKPDAYVITFRGYEMLLFFWATCVRKPIIFDELVNFTEWMDEHGIIKLGTVRYKLFRRLYGYLSRKARVILADTPAHAEYSARLNRLSLDRYRVVPVGVDETVFHPLKTKAIQSKAELFTVFYCGNMLPLHGLDYVVQAAVLLKKHDDIVFRFAGGKPKTVEAIQAAIAKGAHATHEAWLPFEELPKAAAEAGLCLGGPFGNTLQSQFVITGKTYQFLAEGVPVLIGRNKVNNVFIDKTNCLVVPQADPQALADAILWAKNHPKELAHVAATGHKLYQQHFSQKHVNALITVLVHDKLAA